MFPRVTHQCATLIINSKLSINPVQLACVKPAASVRSEPGSNSHVNWLLNPVYHFVLIKNFLGSFFSNMLDFIFFIYRPHILFTYLRCLITHFASALKKPSSHQCSGPALSAKTLPLNLATSQPVIGLIIHHLKLVNTFFKKFSFFFEKKFLPSYIL